MVLLDETTIVKDRENRMGKLNAWVLHVITKEWRCRFTLLDGTEFIGIPAQLENDKISIYSLNEDGH